MPPSPISEMMRYWPSVVPVMSRRGGATRGRVSLVGIAHDVIVDARFRMRDANGRRVIARRRQRRGEAPMAIELDGRTADRHGGPFDHGPAHAQRGTVGLDLVDRCRRSGVVELDRDAALLGAAP